VFLIGLTGGIASGKSTVAQLLAAHGAETIDADEVARDVVQVGSKGLKAVVQEFGEDVLSENGELNREAMAKMIFSDPNMRLKLEAILHPLIQDRTSQLIAATGKQVVVYAVPLLVEANVQYPFDVIVTVEAGVENQVERLVNSRGLSRLEAQDRINAQATREQRIERADFVIDSSGTHEQLAKQVDSLWESVQQLVRKRQA
jgi:dephospho-CoA kinase